MSRGSNAAKLMTNNGAFEFNFFIFIFPACNMTISPIARRKWIQQKWQSGKQNWTLTCPARQVMFWAESLQCNSPLFNRVAMQVEVPAGQVNFRGSLPCSARNVWNLCCTLFPLPYLWFRTRERKSLIRFNLKLSFNKIHSYCQKYHRFRQPSQEELLSINMLINLIIEVNQFSWSQSFRFSWWIYLFGGFFRRDLTAISSG